MIAIQMEMFSLFGENWRRLFWKKSNILINNKLGMLKYNNVTKKQIYEKLVTIMRIHSSYMCSKGGARSLLRLVYVQVKKLGIKNFTNRCTFNNKTRC